MSAFREDGFAPLVNFPLAWRWTEPRYNVLPPEALVRIRPLRAETASDLVAEAAARCRTRTSAAVLRFSTKRDHVTREAVMAELRALPVRAQQPVVVLWAAQLAVYTEWEVFATYWDDFCYPSSDDVSIWSRGMPWTLCYEHHELFEFRSGQSG